MRPLSEGNIESRRPFLFLPIEIRSRELHSKLILSHASLNRQFTPIVGEAQKILNFAVNNSCPGDIFLHKSGLETKWVLALKRRCIFFCILDEELSPSGEGKSWAAGRIASNVAQYVDLYLASDLTYAAEISAGHPQLINKTRTVGFLRMDLLSSEVKARLEHFSVPGRKTSQILICTGFGVTKKWQLVSAIIVELNYLAREMKQQLKPSKFKDGNNITEKIRTTFRTARSSFRSLSSARNFAKDLDAVCGQLPDRNFILRPHPSEDQVLWTSASKNIQNLEVRSDIPLEIEFLTTCLLVHFGSTTAFQARDCGISSISLTGVYNWKVLNNSDLISKMPKSLSEAVEIMRRTEPRIGWADQSRKVDVAKKILDSLEELQFINPSDLINPTLKNTGNKSFGKVPKQTVMAKILKVLDIGQTRPHESEVNSDHVMAGFEMLFGPENGISVKMESGCFILNKSPTGR